MVLAQVTLAVLVVLTWFFACGAADYRALGSGTVDYPLVLVFQSVRGNGWLLKTFNIVALSGMIVSYNGMLYATSRQSFSLGRAGYLPTVLGKVHPIRRTPHVSLLVWTGVTIAFILFGHFFEQATAVAVLMSTLPALVYYVMAMICLFALRKNEPGLPRPYRVPMYPLLPVFVTILSMLAAYSYAKTNVNVLLPTTGLYAVAAVWYFLRGRRSVLPVAPEEVSARIAAELRRGEIGKSKILAPKASLVDDRSILVTLLERVTAATLVVGLFSIGWMTLADWLQPAASVGYGVLAGIILWSMLFGLVSVVGLLSTWSRPRSH